MGTAVLAAGAWLAAGAALAQEGAERRPGVPPRPLPDGPVVLDSAEYGQIRIVVVTRGLEHPWGLAFLPGGDVLVTERPGRLRRIVGGVLDPTPISGAPVVHAEGIAGLMDVALHPEFAANRLLYLTYSKPRPAGPTVALARGRLDGGALADLEDLVILDPPGSGASHREWLLTELRQRIRDVRSGPDGLLYVLTDADDGALLRIEPVASDSTGSSGGG